MSGWGDVIGNWNPLNVIADAVAERRRQNTERERIRTEAVTARETNRLKAEVEQLRIRGDVLKTVITSNSQLLNGSGSDRLIEVERRILEPTEGFVWQLAKEAQVEDIALLSSDNDAPKGDVEK